MIKQTEHYILSPIIDHKEKYDLGGIEIKISKDWENNLRTRNCQLGVVEAIPQLNPLELTLGDIVFVNHFTFHGDIGANRAFTFNDHVVHEGKMLFKVPIRNILFKYNNETIEVVGQIVIVQSEDQDKQTPNGISLPETQFKDRGRVIYSKDESIIGKIVLVERNALYPLELKGLEYNKVFQDEIIAVLDGDEIYPTDGRVVLEDQDDNLSSSILDLSMVKQNNTIRAKIIKTGKLSRTDEWMKAGDMVLRFRGGGVKINGQVVVSMDDDNIHGVLL